jgi:hypothetical protein
MRRKFLAAGAVITLAFGSAAAAEAATVFSYSGAEVVWTAPVAGVYDITAFGAQGGQDFHTPGGLGAEIGGDVTLAAGAKLIIVVGGQGGPGTPELADAGGGGGSFVVAQGAATPLVVAGGGGGGNYDNYPNLAPTPGQAGPDGSGHNGVPSESGGAGGYGPFGGGGGGGFYGDGSQDLSLGLSGTGCDGVPCSGAGGGSFQDGAAGGLGYNSGGTLLDSNGLPLFGIGGTGGFGGGGGGGAFGGGGGGGYTGGSGGDENTGGGGGGSYFTGTPLIDLAGVNPENGQVDIELIQATASAAPEPTTWMLLLCGAAAVGGALRRHRWMVTSAGQA